MRLIQHSIGLHFSIQFLMNFDKILENDRAHFPKFQTLKKISLKEKIDFADFFSIIIFFEFFIPFYFLCLKSKANKNLDNFVQNINNLFFYSPCTTIVLRLYRSKKVRKPTHQIYPVYQNFSFSKERQDKQSNLIQNFESQIFVRLSNI